MAKIPTECRARHNAIYEISKELLESFSNGNKSTVRDELNLLSQSFSLAVLAQMMMDASFPCQKAWLSTSRR